MAAFLLESLVLRGCVRQDVLAVGLRRGLGTIAAGKTNPRNIDSVNAKPGTTTPTGYEPDAEPTVSGTQPGAGRSCRVSMVPSLGSSAPPRLALREGRGQALTLSTLAVGVVGAMTHSIAPWSSRVHTGSMQRTPPVLTRIGVID